jgi:hypothetical protein
LSPFEFEYIIGLFLKQSFLERKEINFVKHGVLRKYKTKVFSLFSRKASIS